MLLKFQIISGQIIRLQNDINFSETPCILLFLKYVFIQPLHHS